MQNKITLAREHFSKFVAACSDPRAVGQVVFVIIVLLVSWSGIKSIESNYVLQKQIGSLAQQNELQKLQNENLKLKNNYYNSPQYLELAARQNFPLAAPGETEVVVPASVAASYVTSLPDPVANDGANATGDTGSGVAVSDQRSNVRAWIDFLLHRSQ